MSQNMSQKWYCKYLFLVVVGLLFFVVQRIDASVKNDFLPPPTARAAAIIAMIQEKQKQNTLTDQELLALTDEFQQEKTRSIQAAEKDSASVKINYGPTVFAGANQFYLGALGAPDNTLANVQDKTLVRASIMGNPGTAVMNFTPLAGSMVNINGAVGTNNQLILVASPLQSKAIQKLTLLNAIQPVAAIAPAVPTVANGSLNTIVVLEDVLGGTSVTTNQTNMIQDAGIPTSQEITAPVAALAASADTIFAAVAPGVPAPGNVFGQVNSGIVRLQKTTTGVTAPATRDLQVLMTSGSGFGAGPAYAIDLTASPTTAAYVPINTGVRFSFTSNSGMPTVASGITMAQLGPVVDMYWDSTLARLYVALSGATGVANTNPPGANKGGVISLLVGRIDPTLKQMFLSPVVDFQLAGQKIAPLLTLNSDEQIIGFNADDATKHVASLFKVRVMHTSTGHDYVIVNGGVTGITTTNPLNTQVYALPVVPTSATADPKQVGLLAKQATIATNPFVIVSAAGDLLTNKSPAAVVGQGAGLPSADQTQQVTDMRIVGDTVYISVSGDRSNNNKNAGIFASTALFDHNGIIRSWTPWQRVMGSTDVVKGFGIDEQLDNFWYLTTADGLKNDGKENTAKATQWGTTNSVNAGNASVYLASKFPQEKAGVHHVFSFSEKTPGFKEDEFAMAAAVGLDTVALYQTGKLAPTATSHVLGLTSDILSDANVFIFNDATVQALGPITSVEVSRSVDTKNPNQGWVFIGGYNGVGVLSKPTGDGFNGVTGLAELSKTAGQQFPGSGFAFRALMTTGTVSFSHTRKLQSDGTNLYIMTRDNLYIWPMNKDSFKLNPTSISSTDVTTVNVTGASLSDFIVINGNIILATTNGLYVSSDGEMPTKVANGPCGPIVQLQYFSESRTKPSNTGNLYVLAADMSQSSARLHRFDVNLGGAHPVITPINPSPTGTTTGEIINFNEFKGNAVTDGSFIFSELSKHFGEMYFVNMNPVDSLTSTYQITPMLGIPDCSGYNVGMMIRDDASGAWIVPLDSGIRVNQ